MSHFPFDTIESLLFNPNNNDKGECAVVALGRSLGREADFSAALPHDETVSSFGRNDGSLVPGEENGNGRRRQRRRGNGNGNPIGLFDGVWLLLCDEISVRTSEEREVRPPEE